MGLDKGQQCEGLGCIGNFWNWDRDEIGLGLGLGCNWNGIEIKLGYWIGIEFSQNSVVYLIVYLSGNFGEVYRGSLQTQHQTVEVAVKKLKNIGMT